METSKQHTAKILAFPTERHHAKQQKQAPACAKELKSSRATTLVEFGSCWYHDEAILHVGPIDKK